MSLRTMGILAALAIFFRAGWAIGVNPELHAGESFGGRRAGTATYNSTGLPRVVCSTRDAVELTLTFRAVGTRQLDYTEFPRMLLRIQGDLAAIPEGRMQQTMGRLG